MAWKAELSKKTLSKEAAMKKRRGLRKKMVMVLAEGNHLIVGNFPRHQGDGESLPPVLLSHSPSQSSKKVVGENFCVAPPCVIFHKLSLVSQEYAELGDCAFPLTQHLLLPLNYATKGNLCLQI